jgi:hypothetical protein
MVNDAISAVNVIYASVYELFSRMKQTGSTGLDVATSIKTRKAVEDTIGLDRYYEIEAQTVEARPQFPTDSGKEDTDRHTVVEGVAK